MATENVVNNMRLTRNTLALPIVDQRRSGSGTIRLAICRSSLIVHPSCLLVLVGLVVSPASAVERSIADRLDKANAIYAKGDYETALQTYKALETDCPVCPELAYNQGLAYYRKRDFAAARDKFNEALTTRGVGLEQRAKYNLGNVAYAQALEKMTNLQEAIEHAQRAIAHYRDALELDAKDVDARANIETAQLLIKDLLDKQKKQQEQQQQDQQQQKQNGQQQDQQQDKQQSQEHQKQEEEKEQEEKEGKEEEAQQEEEEKQQEGQEQQEKEEQAQEQQGQEQQQEDQQQQEQQQAQEADAREVREMSPEEAERMLQAVRDKEAKRREDLARRQQVKRAPVRRDW